MAVRAYLRASTNKQDASRAKKQVMQFATDKGLTIDKIYIEHASGATLKRDKLNELLADCNIGDMLIIESIDRLTRLNAQDWQTLKNRIKSLGLLVVVLDIPTTHNIAQNANDETQQRINTALNDMFIDLFATFAQKDYQQRRERQAQGIAKAKAQGKYQGRQPNVKRYQSICKLLDAKHSYREICTLLKCSPNTIKSAIEWRKKTITK